MPSEMNMKLLQQFDENIRSLWGSKIVHEVSDLEKIVSHISIIFADAQQRQAVFPHLEMAQQMVDLLVSFREKLSGSRSAKNDDEGIERFIYHFGVGPYTFSFPIPPSGAHAALQELYPAVCKAQSELDLFNAMHQSIGKHISLKVLPDKEFGTVYFAAGKLIIPTTLRMKGYHVFSFNVSRNNGEWRISEFEPLHEYGYTSLKKALKDHVDTSTIQTVAVARNTYDYPLEETVLPILGEKYLSAFCEENELK